MVQWNFLPRTDQDVHVATTFMFITTLNIALSMFQPKVDIAVTGIYIACFMWI